MELYAGIDLLSNNSVVSVLDEQDRTVSSVPSKSLIAMVFIAACTIPSGVRGLLKERT